MLENNKNYRDSHKKPGKGYEYDEKFVAGHRGYLWESERRVLKSILSNKISTSESVYLDFACGTGRLISVMEDYVDESVGIDISDSMLAEARKKVRKSKLYLGDITERDPFVGRKFDFITAFRFFPNAEDELRKAALKTLSEKLSAEGRLVFNNHKNRYSIVGIVMRIYCRLRGATFRTMTLSEIEELTKSCGLKVEEIHHLSVFPGYEWLMIMPRSWYLFFDRMLANIKILKYVALDHIVVCKKI
jgi:ubiquinone/menaquinone biosynthesis C-methylase UbiE